MKLPLVIVMMMIALASGVRGSVYSAPKKLDSLLQKAVSEGDTHKVFKLLKGGANIYVEDEWGLTPVGWSFLRDSAMFQFLVRHGVRITRKSPAGMSLLHLIAGNDQQYHDRPQRVTPELLTQLLTSKNDVNAVRGSGATPLHTAAFNGNLELAKQLIEAGARINARDTIGATPLHYTSGDNTRFLPKGWGICGLTSEQWARHTSETRAGRIAVAAYLIEHGADVNALDNEHNTPLHWRRFDGCDTLVKLAMQHGLRANIANDEGETLLHTCAEGSDDGSAIAALIAAGLDVNKRGEFGETPLQRSIERGNLNVVTKLLAAKPDLSIRNKFGLTAYRKAQEWNRPEVAALLREAGAEEFEPAPLNDTLQQMIEKVAKRRK